MLNPVPDGRLSASHNVSATVQKVVDVLFQRIQSGEYGVDQRLPSERMLASDLSVARNTVREALDVLEKQGLIRRSPGSGSFVNPKSDQGPLTHSKVGAETSPLNLQVTRGVLEPEIVRLAVMNMSPRQIEALEETLTKIEAVRTDAEAFVQLEEDFYRKLAEGTGNPLLASCYDMVIDCCRQSFRVAHLRRHLTPARIEDYQRRYNSLFNAVASRDIERAVEFIRLHLIEEQRLLLQDF
ncbi:FadR/GntR family transcriptional regulator [Pacificoceanicola onchidii]|uniref:FadR/GntR family transcriptional regulator n=1 Tax=Pacificoceanicola onchidii TaxID=2562685 RepID=UPI0010A4EB65|nr:FCD domain-containing protein [Pacificoceanicola onchidii]